MVSTVLLTVALAAWTGAERPSPRDVNRVIAIDTEAEALLRDGLERSATFRALVAAIQRSHWRVFVYSGTCPVRETVGCLLHAIGRMDGERALYIRIAARARRRDLAVATLAHELQHASEVVQADVSDPKGIRALFERIGFENVVAGQTVAYETADAEHTGDRVRQELADDRAAVAAADASIR